MHHYDFLHTFLVITQFARINKWISSTGAITERFYVKRNENFNPLNDISYLCERTTNLVSRYSVPYILTDSKLYHLEHFLRRPKVKPKQCSSFHYIVCCLARLNLDIGAPFISKVLIYSKCSWLEMSLVTCIDESATNCLRAEQSTVIL